MKLTKNTYKTIGGTVEIIEKSEDNNVQFVVYEDKKPKFYVDLYDLSNESNAMMNSLVLCAKRSMAETLLLLNKKNKTNLSLLKPSHFWFKKKIKSEEIDLDLEPLPEEWLDYSL